LDDVTRGERLIKTVYETIRNCPHWNESLLLIVYDEQGGFFDHVAPPQAVAPGDGISDMNNNHHSFDFAQLGVRVPSVVVSPLIPDNLVDHTIYDHSSLLATVEKLFNFSPLTDRDAQANTFSHLLSLNTPRTDTPATLPEPANSGFVCVDDDARKAPGAPQIRAKAGLPDAAALNRSVDSLSGSERGFLHVAFLRDYHRANLLRKRVVLRRFRNIRTAGQARDYIDSVRKRVWLMRRGTTAASPPPA
jgi:hypothetical protein